MKKRIIACFLFTLLILSGLLGVAQAELHYSGYDYVQGAEFSGYYYGAYSMNYIPTNAKPYYGVKRNSIIASRADETSYVEAGWEWYSDQTKPNFYIKWTNNSTTGYKTFGAVTAGTNHSFELSWIKGTSNWAFLVDGTEKTRVTVSNLTSAVVIASACHSNKANSGESNYGHFWNLKKATGWSSNGSRLWSYFTDLRAFFDSDKEYQYYEISNSEFYSVKG